MTANQDIQSIELQKARYSKELAAYTLRQWDLVRKALEDESRRDSKASTPRDKSQRSRSVSVPRNTSMAQQGVLAHDYAQSAHRQTTSGGRAVHA